MSKTLYKRAFLNLDRFGGTSGGMASVRYKEGEFSISDCNRTIDLDFYIEEEHPNKNDLDNIEYKINTLYEFLSEYRRFVKRKLRKVRKNNGWVEK